MSLLGKKSGEALGAPRLKGDNQNGNHRNPDCTDAGNHADPRLRKRPDTQQNTKTLAPINGGQFEMEWWLG